MTRPGVCAARMCWIACLFIESHLTCVCVCVCVSVCVCLRVCGSHVPTAAPVKAAPAPAAKAAPARAAPAPAPKDDLDDLLNDLTANSSSHQSANRGGGDDLDALLNDLEGCGTSGALLLFCVRVFCFL